MKKNVLLVLLLAFVVSLYAKDFPESSVPQPVKTYVSSKYPNAGHIEWASKKDKSYTALFFIDGREVNMEVSPDGKLLSSTEVIFTRSLPAAVTSYVNNNYTDAEIVNSTKITKGDDVTYAVEVVGADKGGYSKPQKLIFDKEGKLLKK